jgi:methyl-accepting chemotaxis protein
MATTTRKPPAKPAKPPAKPAKTRKPPAKPAKTSLDHLQEAMADLEKARQAATGEIRASIDTAIERMRGIATDLRERAGDLGSRAGDDTREFEESLDRASEQLRVELGLRAIRAQDSVEALTKLSAEIRRRKAQLTA